jgi:hypothetical protein
MKPGDTVRIRLSLNRVDRESTWAFEKGAWRMSNFEIHQANRLEEEAGQEEETEAEEADEQQENDDQEEE